jgi:hypothetical protein
MKVVATINGVPVFSDKQVSGVNNTKVSFTDGSWCDAETGEVVNKGPGSISVKTQPKKSAEEDEETKAFQCDKLQVSNVDANVNIRPHNLDEIRVTLKGPKDELSAIKVDSLNGTVFVEGPETGSSKGSSSSISIVGGNFGSCISASNIRISGNNVNISMGSSEPSVTATIYIPIKAAVALSGICGRTVVGDTLGEIQAYIQGGYDMDIGHVGSTMISIQGSGDVDVAKVEGPSLTARVQGSGDINVKDGLVDILELSVQGSGDIDYGGRAKNANLRVMGSGDIDVKHVDNRPAMSSMGNGDITVRNWN